MKLLTFIRLSWCRWSLLGLIVLQPLWYGWWNPPTLIPTAAALAIALLPLLVVMPGAWRLHGNTLVVAGCFLLVYFCYAVMEAWILPEARLPALTQVALITVYFAALPTIRRKSKAKTD